MIPAFQPRVGFMNSALGQLRHKVGLICGKSDQHQSNLCRCANTNSLTEIFTTLCRSPDNVISFFLPYAGQPDFRQPGSKIGQLRCNKVGKMNYSVYPALGGQLISAHLTDQIIRLDPSEDLRSKKGIEKNF